MQRNAPDAAVALRVDGSAMVLRRAIAVGVGVQFLPCFYAEGSPGPTRIGPTRPELMVHPRCEDSARSATSSTVTVRTRRRMRGDAVRYALEIGIGEMPSMRLVARY